MTEVLPRFGVVVLTMGRRPEELDRGVRSVLAQEGVQADVVVVGNGWQPEGLPDGVRGLGLPENIGIPAGRNAGVPHVAGDLLFFLDDDAWLPDPGFLRTLADRFAIDPDLGLVQPRVVDPTGVPSPGRWVPRLRVGDPAEPGPATALWEGAVVMRRCTTRSTAGPTSSSTPTRASTSCGGSGTPDTRPGTRATSWCTIR